MTTPAVFPVTLPDLPRRIGKLSELAAGYGNPQRYRK